MKLIAENLHIISKTTKEAILARDSVYIENLIKKMSERKPDWIDLNIGPARANFSGTMKWLMEILNDITDIPVSFDTTNTEEIREGLILAKKPSACLINSTSADIERLEKTAALAAESGTNIIALTMNSDIGIPKECDARLELAMEIQSFMENAGICNEKLYFDPLVLPVGVDQSQAGECLNTLRMLKESFEPAVHSTIGLSNVSNGCPAELRPLINRVFLVMAAGCGLDSAIVDIFDSELCRVIKAVESQTPEKASDEAFIDLYDIMKNFGEIEDLVYNAADAEQTAIFKTAEILLNKKVYTNSYLAV